MGQLFNNLENPSWWIGVVLVGVTTSLIASYLKPKTDGFLSSISNKWSKSSERKRKSRSDLIEALSNCTDSRISFNNEILYTLISEIRGLIMAVILTVITITAEDANLFPKYIIIIFSFLTAFLFIFSFVEFLTYMKNREIIKESYVLIKEKNKNT